MRFPDRFEVQCVMSPEDKVGQLMELLRPQLKHSAPFYLCASPCSYVNVTEILTDTTPPRKRLSPEVTVLQAGLVPSAVVMFAWERGENNQVCNVLTQRTIDTEKALGFLKEEVAATAEAFPITQPQPQPQTQPEEKRSHTTQAPKTSSNKVPSWFQKGKK